MISPEYRAQVDLLLLPLVATEDNFAPKGGTATNLFVRDMPDWILDDTGSSAAQIAFSLPIL